MWETVCWGESWSVNEQCQLSVRAWGLSTTAGAACAVRAGPAEMLMLPFWAFSTNSELQAAWACQAKPSTQKGSYLGGCGPVMELCSFQPPDQRGCVAALKQAQMFLVGQCTPWAGQVHPCCSEDVLLLSVLNTLKNEKCNFYMNTSGQHPQLSLLSLWYIISSWPNRERLWICGGWKNQSLTGTIFYEHKSGTILCTQIVLGSFVGFLILGFLHTLLFEVLVSLILSQNVYL